MRLKGMHEEKFSFRFAVTPSRPAKIAQLRFVLKGLGDLVDLDQL
jgi:hypothetical protein